jgi:aminoglycoside 6-adenylyltransferase
MKFQLLRQLLEWRIEIDHNWSWKPGVAGRGLKNHLDSRSWSEFANTYVGEGIDENWDALFKPAVLFRRMAKEVGDALGYRYPSDLDERVTSYLRGIRNLER